MRLALALVLLAGCNQLVGFDDGKLRVADAGGGPGDGPPIIPDAMPIDAEPPDAIAGVCDLIAQTGCGGGEKCTWITTDTANDAGLIGCAPAGAVVRGGACTRGADGVATGFDNCGIGDYCIGYSGAVMGQCEAICNTSPDSCGTAQTCGQFSNLFGGALGMGLCNFECDPVTQRRTLDNAAACGSPITTTPEYGCYQYDEQPGICSRTPTAAVGLTQGQIAYDWPGTVYLNGCAPGFMGMAESTTVGATVRCTAYCRPQETSTASTAGFGGVPGSGYTCGDCGATGKECHFFWYFQDMPELVDDGVGFCWTPGDYLFDIDNDGTVDDPHPTCTSLPNIDTDGDSYPQHYQFGCAPHI